MTLEEGRSAGGKNPTMRLLGVVLLIFALEVGLSWAPVMIGRVLNLNLTAATAVGALVASCGGLGAAVLMRRSGDEPNEVITAVCAALSLCCWAAVIGLFTWKGPFARALRPGPAPIDARRRALVVGWACVSGLAAFAIAAVHPVPGAGLAALWLCWALWWAMPSHRTLTVVTVARFTRPQKVVFDFLADPREAVRAASVESGRYNIAVPPGFRPETGARYRVTATFAEGEVVFDTTIELLQRPHVLVERTYPPGAGGTLEVVSAAGGCVATFVFTRTESLSFALLGLALNGKERRRITMDSRRALWVRMADLIGSAPPAFSV